MLEDPRLLGSLCKPIAQRFQDAGVDIVVGPTLGGVLVAYEVARQMGKKAVFAERASNEEGRFFRPPIILQQGHRVLIVDDVLMTGWTLTHLGSAVRGTGAEICGIGIILDRSAATPAFTCPLFAVHRMEIPDYDPESCPLCGQGLPLTKAAGTT
ncbi:phosphoribosyltransferase family protein [Candidatus Poribacteria bacterium]